MANDQKYGDGHGAVRFDEGEEGVAQGGVSPVAVAFFRQRIRCWGAVPTVDDAAIVKIELILGRRQRRTRSINEGCLHSARATATKKCT